MKPSCLLLLACFAMPVLHAQNIDLGKFYFTATEIHFPKQVVPEDKRTYKYTGFNKDTVNFNENNAIQLGGFVKAETGNVEISSRSFSFAPMSPAGDVGMRVVKYFGLHLVPPTATSLSGDVAGNNTSPQSLPQGTLG